MQSLKSLTQTQANLTLPTKTAIYDESVNGDDEINMDSFQKPYNEDLYSFIPLKCYEDEVANKLFFFNERVEPPLNQCFYSNYALLSKELYYYNQEGYYYITSHLTEKIEGMIIYASLNPYEIDIFYLASSQKTSFKEIVQFVIQRMQSLLGINKFKMRVMHTRDAKGHLRVDSFINETLDKLGFKINSVVNSPPPGKKYSIFIFTSAVDICLIQKNLPGFKLSCQILLSNERKLVKNLSRQPQKNLIDYKVLVFLCFLYYLKNYNAQKKQLRFLTGFDLLLSRFETTKDQMKAFQVSSITLSNYYRKIRT